MCMSSNGGDGSDFDDLGEHPEDRPPADGSVADRGSLSLPDDTLVYLAPLVAEAQAQDPLFQGIRCIQVQA